MPLLKFDIFKGRTDQELKTLLDTAHEAILSAFGVPQKDRYQIVHLHDTSDTFIVQDSGLDIPRTKNMVLVQVTSRKRTEKQKLDFYRLLTEGFEKECHIKPSDVMITFVENTDADWSFGYGKAQFITKELK